MAYLTSQIKLEKNMIVDFEVNEVLHEKTSQAIIENITSFLKKDMQIFENITDADFKQTEYFSRIILITKKETIEELFSLIRRVNTINPRIAEQLSSLIKDNL